MQAVQLEEEVAKYDTDSLIVQRLPRANSGRIKKWEGSGRNGSNSVQGQGQGWYLMPEWVQCVEISAFREATQLLAISRQHINNAHSVREITGGKWKKREQWSTSKGKVGNSG